MTREELKKEIKVTENSIETIEHMRYIYKLYGNLVQFERYEGYLAHNKLKLDELTKELYKNHNKLLKGLGEE